MKIRLTLDVDSDDQDETNKTGLTEEAYDRLMSAIGDAGFGVDAGPARADVPHGGSPA